MYTIAMENMQGVNLSTVADIAHVVFAPAHILRSKWHHDTAHEIVILKIQENRK